MWHHFLTPIFDGLKHGRVEFSLPSGGRLVFGPEGVKVPTVKVDIHSNRTLWTITTRGMLGIAESFMAAHWSCDNLARLFDICLKNKSIYDHILERGLVARWFAHLKHLTKANTLKGSRKNIAFHYDLGNDFYSLWLDPTMAYSSAYGISDNEPLEAAQIRKFDKALDLSAVKEGDHILEIGCGWGGLAERAANRGCEVDALTLSQEQLQFSQIRALKNGFADKARFHLRDYRHEQGQYDAIVSIEMIEAVGQENWQTYFRCLHDNLRPGGRATLQAITLQEDRFDSYSKGADFIQAFVFPGGMLPTQEHIKHFASKAGLVPVHQETFGLDYAKTLALWAKNFLDQWPKVSELGFDERFRRLWLFYLAYCEAGFANNTINVGHYSFQRPA